MQLTLAVLATLSSTGAGATDLTAREEAGRSIDLLAADPTCSFEIHNASGCTAAGHYASPKAGSPAECCAHCSEEPGCNAWSFHAGDAECYLATTPKLAKNSGTKDTTCGCKHAGCSPGPPAPAPPAGRCDPVQRPPKPTTIPLPAGKTRPHIVTVLVDDLGFADASIRADHQSFSQCPGAGCVTPHLQALRKEGILLDRHHTFLWCSPTRRSFLTGRYPVHVTGTQAPTCSNLTPLQFTILSEKLAAADYESHFIGKGHLGYWTTDHLPVNRGFHGHLGFLGGGESYVHGLMTRCGDGGIADMWHDHEPAVDLVGGDFYNTNFFTSGAIDAIKNRNTSKPLWLHLLHQAVHTGDHRSPPEWEQWPGQPDYMSALHVLDDGIGNLTAQLRDSKLWDNTIFMLSADNGGDCGYKSGFASNYPLLGRKCQSYDGGTRTAAFVAGGLIPVALRGTTNDDLFHVADWYHTLSKLAGVDPADDWTDPETKLIHGIDGVDLWPSLMGTGKPEREFLPTSCRSILWDNSITVQGTSGARKMWKLILLERRANRFHMNGSQYLDTSLPCVNTTDGPPQPVGNDSSTNVPWGNGCIVCSPEKPCLFEVISDPSETTNLAAANPDIVAKMAQTLETFKPYVPTLTPDNLACYDCGDGPRAPPVLFWQNFSGPCCVRKSAKGGVKTDDSVASIEVQASPPAGGTITIAPGVDMPIIANGYSPFTANDNTTTALEQWFRVGGRAVDTAFEYSNEPWVGNAVRAAVASGLSRKEIFVITKIKCQGTTEGALALVREDLKRLQLDYVDLVIIHGPGYVDPQSGGSRQCDGWRFNPDWKDKGCCKTVEDLQATYRGLELAVAQNLSRAIGVSNFQTKQLEAIAANATIPPAVNQMQMYVGCSTAWCMSNNDTIATGKKHGTVFQAYSPLGHGKAMKNAAVVKIAADHKVSTAQVALAWIVQQGHALVTSSNDLDYDKEDLAVADVKLTDAEIRELNAQRE